MKKVRFGIIGAGGIADRRTLPGMMKAEHAEIAAIMEVDAARAEELRKKYGAKRAYTTAAELVRDPGLDAVYIASPLAYHEEAIRLAADAGLHILSEKPLALTREAGEALVSYCREKGVLLTAGFMMRFGTHASAMRNAVREGKLGEIVACEANFSCWYPEIPGSWRQSPKTGGGGALMDMGIHCIDLIRYITGMEVTEVTGMHGTLTFSYPVEDSSAVLMRLENGAAAVVLSNFNIPDEACAWRLALYGTGGRMTGEFILGQEDGGTLKTVFTKAGGYNAMQDHTSAEESGNEEPAFGDLYEREVESFCLSVLEGKPLEVPAAEAVADQKIVEAAYKAGNEGKTVRL